MIICPNCNYQNPEGASQCEACYTPLPELLTCSNCGATVQADASFCGQCGHSLANQAVPVAEPSAPAEPVSTDDPPTPLPVGSSSDLIEPDPLVPPDPLSVAPPPPLPADPVPETIPTAVDIVSEPPTTQPMASVTTPQTQIQIQTARLLHIQTDTILELPLGLDLIHMGKPNDRIPPDLDVSGFPESEIVSRVHANIRIEGDVYYIEDVGSSNGTYINNLPLAVGNRHRLRPGDRIALGKGDKVSFIFQLA
ncbi:FHA domain-containing protein [Leptolyngbyaceae cyanobacterium CCMR0082]|uniref:FHA domain-containing protein n=2 Tax=Adonisia turfae TaxID=2950184 RepID=A0A6M0S7Q9_9CYAN|nr:FHA domain-containing protein [Adonisia turfae]MDV3347620.1 FHA domain-containing protein [Leptothoe sp. LEGE 181152]NEZ55772.1 FHA domain-containing protein [Adonisia turfae CCMR0081]NEZ64426.1 FHA domain-containing protein [Adonisia turfae CCMR0082]